MRQAIVQLVDVWKQYGNGAREVAALCGVNMSLYGGEFLAIMGPSGSGKSTLLHILGCLDRPTKGTVMYEGQNLSANSLSGLWKIRNEKIGFVFQQHHLVPTLTAQENVMLPLKYAKCPRQTARARAKNLLDEVGLGERLNHRPSQLSGGEQARVSIARALVNEPSILLADEPTGELDSQTGWQVLDILKQRIGPDKVIVIITHDHDVANCCQRTHTMKDGWLLG